MKASVLFIKRLKRCSSKKQTQVPLCGKIDGVKRQRVRAHTHTHARTQNNNINGKPSNIKD